MIGGGGGTITIDGRVPKSRYERHTSKQIVTRQSVAKREGRKEEGMREESYCFKFDHHMPMNRNT